MGKVKPRWWCIKKECKYFNKLYCTHPNIPNKKIRTKLLKMCPVFCSIEACLGKT